ncbi:MAG: glycosyltransferase family 4 protein [Solirubrobacteraceae bacterium]
MPSARPIEQPATAEPTQDSTAAVLCRLAGGPAPRRGAQGALEGEEFPWCWRARPELKGVDPAQPEPAEQLPTVAYLLPGLPPEGSGGSHSLVQEARGLRELGGDARICVPSDSLTTAAALYGNEDGLFAAYRADPAFPGVSDSSLLDAVAGADVAVATEYPSVELLARLTAARPDIACAYYVQDYEPLFAPPGSSRSDRALLSYRALPGQTLFAKTHWLCNVVSELHGLPVAKVTPSLDRDLFHARGRPPDEGVLRVAAMVRPRTPRRRPAATLAALAGIARALGEAAALQTFGCDDRSFVEIPGHEVEGLDHLGLLDRREVSELMRRCDVFIDASAYQAFGRSGLEAMACGAVPVLPALGGVHEFAQHERNAIILADGSPQAIADAVIGLALDCERLDSLRCAGVLGAEDFTAQNAARSQLELFSVIVDRPAPVGHPPPPSAVPGP